MKGIVDLMTASVTPLLEQLKAAALEQHPDKLLTKQEAADILGVTTETVTNYVNQRKITPYYYGIQKSPLFRHGDLLTIKNQKKK